MSGRSDGPAGGSTNHAYAAAAQADVVIAGASFAGLAAARALGGRALLVDPVPVGEGQTSACGAPVGVIESLGAQGSIQQRHDELIFH